MHSELAHDLDALRPWDRTTPGSGTKEILRRLLAVAGVMRGVPLELEGPLLAWRDEVNEVRWVKLCHGFLVGRSPGCGLVLKNRHVSRCHLRFMESEHGFTVQDLKSSNGTKINGYPVEDKPRILISGDVIDCGGCGLVFVN